MKHVLKVLQKYDTLTTIQCFRTETPLKVTELPFPRVYFLKKE